MISDLLLGALEDQVDPKLSLHLQMEDEVWCRIISAFTLSTDLARLLPSSPDNIYECFTRVPDNMLSLLDSPQGWAALAVYVADDVGATDATYFPTIH